MTVEFVILHTLFEIERENIGVGYAGFFSDVFYYLHHQLKGLIVFASVCLNYDYFTETFYSILFCSFVFFVNLPRGIIELP